MANSDGMRLNGVGNTVLSVGDTEIVANNVLHVPNLSVNLLSICKILELGNTVVFTRNGCVIKNEDGATLARCIAENGVYKLMVKKSSCLLAAKAETAYN